MISQTSYKALSLLFDMDGTLIDSRASIKNVWQRFANKYRLDVNKILSIDKGRRTDETLSLLGINNLDIQAETNEITDQEIADTYGVKAMAGAKAILEQLPLDRWGIVTSASKELALGRMKAAQLPLPSVFITAEDVKNGKPDPDGYLQAARLLSVKPNECIVFEDSLAGLQAAANAGMRAFAIGDNDILDEIYPHKYEVQLPDFTKIKLYIPKLLEEHLIITIDELT
jgi:sugar-phosphatase